MPQRERRDYRVVGALAGVGLSLAISTAAGALIGYWLDQRWRTLPWLTAVGVFVGLGAGFLEMVSLLRRLDSD